MVNKFKDVMESHRAWRFFLTRDMSYPGLLHKLKSKEEYKYQ